VVSQEDNQSSGCNAVLIILTGISLFISWTSEKATLTGKFFYVKIQALIELYLCVIVVFSGKYEMLRSP